LSILPRPEGCQCVFLYADSIFFVIVVRALDFVARLVFSLNFQINRLRIS
jgi:hypothetical protein